MYIADGRSFSLHCSDFSVQRYIPVLCASSAVFRLTEAKGCIGITRGRTCTTQRGEKLFFSTKFTGESRKCTPRQIKSPIFWGNWGDVDGGRNYLCSFRVFWGQRLKRGRKVHPRQNPGYAYARLCKTWEDNEKFAPEGLTEVYKTVTRTATKSLFNFHYLIAKHMKWKIQIISKRIPITYLSFSWLHFSTVRVRSN